MNKLILIILLAVVIIPALAKIHPPLQDDSEEWGYTKFDSSWCCQSTFLKDIIIGGSSPDEDNMKIVSIRHYVDNYPVDQDNTFFKFAIYLGGTTTDPNGAVKVFESYPYYVTQDRWQETEVYPPIDWTKNTPTWIYLSDYNGKILTKWSVDSSPFEKTGFFKVPFKATSIYNPLTDTIINAQYYGKAYGVYLEYTTEPTIEELLQQIYILEIFQQQLMDVIDFLLTYINNQLTQ